jgi:putative transposase
MSLTRAIAIMAGGPRSPTKARSSALYKVRWQIELLFRWIKQHLHIRRFLGNNDNAIRLQLFAAMIALCLFERRHIGAIDKPPPVNPSRPQCQNSQNQLSLSYA